jgi:hypothetical protein
MNIRIYPPHLGSAAGCWGKQGAVVETWVLVPSLPLSLPLDETEFERIFRNVRRTDLVPEVVIVIFYTVLPEYLQTEEEIELAGRVRQFLPHAMWNGTGQKKKNQKAWAVRYFQYKYKYKYIISDLAYLIALVFI